MKEMVMTSEEIQAACKRIGQQISADLKDEKKTPLILGVMKGAMNFMMDLIKNIDIPIFTDYIQLSSYNGTSTTGSVKLLKDLTYDIKDRTIIVVEDVIDSGYSMHHLINHLCEKYEPKQVKICALFDKIYARKIDVPVDYVGRPLTKNDFLVGYGLDYNEFERNVPYVYIATEDDVKRWNDILEKEKNM